MVSSDGKYPNGRSLLVRGSQESALIDPSLDLITRRHELDCVDRLIHSHCHEDHCAGSHLFPNAPWHFHEGDLPAAKSIETILKCYGYSPELERKWRLKLIEDFHFTPREDAVPYRDGDIFSLGRCSIRSIHLPGHTWGHCALHIEPDDILFLGDIDLSSFGPYYGEMWSDLEDFEISLRRVRRIKARWYATFHHIGLLEEEAFLHRLDRFEAVISERDRRLLKFLCRPRNLTDIVEHRFIYRPEDNVLFADAVELRSMTLHIERLLKRGQIREIEPDLYQTV